MIRLKLPSYQEQYLFVVADGLYPGNVVFGKLNSRFGSDNLLFKLNEQDLKSIKKYSSSNTGIKRIKLGRSRIQTLKTSEHECDEEKSANSAHDCIIKFLEESIGCSLTGGSKNTQR